MAMGTTASTPATLETDKKQLLERFAEEEAAFSETRLAQQTLERCQLLLEQAKAFYERALKSTQRDAQSDTALASTFDSGTVEVQPHSLLIRARLQLYRSQFNYGWALVQQPQPTGRELVREGIQLLQRLASELERDEHANDENLASECYYFAAYGLYRLGEWSEARNMLRILVSRRDGSSQQRRQASAFLAIVDDRIRRDGWIGLGVATALFGVAGAAVVGGILAMQKLGNRDASATDATKARRGSAVASRREASQGPS